MEHVRQMNKIHPVEKNNPDRFYMKQGYLMTFTAFICFLFFVVFFSITMDNVFIKIFFTTSTFILTVMCLWDGITIVRAGKYNGSWLTLPSPRWFISEDYRAILKYHEKIVEVLSSIDKDEQFGPLSESQLIEKLNRHGIPLKEHVEISVMLKELRHCVNQ
jgi:hypothetical protein